MIRAGSLSLADAESAYTRAASRLSGGEHELSTMAVLRAAEDNRITAYDLEFVVLAQELGVPLVTFDKQVLAAFPAIAIHPAQFVA